MYPLGGWILQIHNPFSASCKETQYPFFHSRILILNFFFQETHHLIAIHIFHSPRGVATILDLLAKNDFYACTGLSLLLLFCIKETLRILHYSNRSKSILWPLESLFSQRSAKVFEGSVKKAQKVKVLPAIPLRNAITYPTRSIDKNRYRKTVRYIDNYR